MATKKTAEDILTSLALIWAEQHKQEVIKVNVEKATTSDTDISRNAG